MKRTFTAVYFFLLLPFVSLAQLSGTLNYGKYPVGFKVIDTKDNAGNPFRLCIWYPAASKGSAMRFLDYVDISSLGGPQEKYDNAINASVAATRDAVPENGNWPLILNDTEPVSLCVTNEFLASHGIFLYSHANRKDQAICQCRRRSLHA